MDMSLDEYISNSKAVTRGRGKGQSAALKSDEDMLQGAFRNARRSQSNKGGSNGKWRHDRFQDHEDDSRDSRGSVLNMAHKKVRLNLSNVAPTVQSADLEELFESYNLTKVSMHFDEEGTPLGTADLTLKMSDANRLMKDFSGIVIDGKAIAFSIVQGGTGTVFDRIEVQGGNRSIRKIGGGVTKRTNYGSGNRRNSSEGRRGRFRNPLDRSEGGGFKGRREGGKQGGRKRMTEQELDAELDAYMNK